MKIFKEVAGRLLDSVTISIENRADGRRVRLIKKMPARRGKSAVEVKAHSWEVAFETGAHAISFSRP